MKPKRFLPVLVSVLSLQPSTWLHAATTINGTNHYAYGANLGWVDWRGDTNNGAVISTNVCSGYIYSANFGWISLGNGAPTNGVHYQNLSANDFGVNVDGSGNLSGYAWGANLGWINFTNVGAPKVDFGSGNLSGSVWSANWGWISLSNTVAYVQTGTLAQPPQVPGTFYLTSATMVSGSGCTLTFAAKPGSPFVVMAATDVSLPLSSWTVLLGSVREVSSGQYQFTDPDAANLPYRFYRVRSQ